MANFSEIRERAAHRKGGDGVLRSLLGEAPDNAKLAGVTDDRILSAMAERIFSAGFVWRVIREKWPGFEAAFLGFQPKALIFQPDDFWQDLLSDKRIVRHGAKIRSVRENAALVARVADEHGSFGQFLSRWPADDEVGLLAWLAKNGSRLGGNTGQYFLRWVGWDAFILSGDVVAALRDSGLEIGEAVTSRRDLAKVQERMNEWARETGLSYTHLSRILAWSTGQNRSAEEIVQRRGGDE